MWIDLSLGTTSCSDGCDSNADPALRPNSLFVANYFGGISGTGSMSRSWVDVDEPT